MSNSAEVKKELFSDLVMAEIGRVGRITDGAKLNDLQAQLRTMGDRYRRIISITPCDLPSAPSNHTLSERLKWLDVQVLNPIRKLLEALDPRARFMLSLWPEEVVDEIMPDFDEVARQLQTLQTLGMNLAIILSVYRRADFPLGQLIRSYIVVEATHILHKVVPEIALSRGTYDAATKQFYGTFPALIRLIFTEITGLHEQLDRLIKEQVDAARNPTASDAVPRFNSFRDMVLTMAGLPLTEGKSES